MDARSQGILTVSYSLLRSKSSFVTTIPHNLLFKFLPNVTIKQTFIGYTKWQKPKN